MATRKLQAEIDRLLKKVSEGVADFDAMFQKVHEATNASQKEKFENELKRVIKKLQRYREQIKSWVASNDIKNKNPLVDSRKIIEARMEQFKMYEKETKTKPYSKEALSRSQETTEEDRTKDELRSWIVKCIYDLKTQIDSFEAELESAGAPQVKGKKKEPGRTEHLQHWLERHGFHVDKLERILRFFDNEQLSTDQIGDIRESIDSYIDCNQEPGYVEDEAVYDPLGLQSLSDDYSDLSDDGSQPGTPDLDKPTKSAEAPLLDLGPAVKVSSPQQVPSPQLPSPSSPLLPTSRPRTAQLPTLAAAAAAAVAAAGGSLNNLVGQTNTAAHLPLATPTQPLPSFPLMPANSTPPGSTALAAQVQQQKQLFLQQQQPKSPNLKPSSPHLRPSSPVSPPRSAGFSRTGSADISGPRNIPGSPPPNSVLMTGPGRLPSPQSPPFSPPSSPILGSPISFLSNKPHSPTLSPVSSPHLPLSISLPPQTTNVSQAASPTQINVLQQTATSHTQMHQIPSAQLPIHPQALHPQEFSNVFLTAICIPTTSCTANPLPHESKFTGEHNHSLFSATGPPGGMNSLQVKSSDGIVVSTTPSNPTLTSPVSSSNSTPFDTTTGAFPSTSTSTPFSSPDEVLSRDMILSSQSLSASSPPTVSVLISNDSSNATSSPNHSPCVTPSPSPPIRVSAAPDVTNKSSSTAPPLTNSESSTDFTVATEGVASAKKDYEGNVNPQPQTSNNKNTDSDLLPSKPFKTGASEGGTSPITQMEHNATTVESSPTTTSFSSPSPRLLQEIQTTIVNTEQIMTPTTQKSSGLALSLKASQTTPPLKQEAPSLDSGLASDSNSDSNSDDSSTDPFRTSIDLMSPPDTINNLGVQTATTQITNSSPSQPSLTVPSQLRMQQAQQLFMQQSLMQQQQQQQQQIQQRILQLQQQQQLLEQQIGQPLPYPTELSPVTPSSPPLPADERPADLKQDLCTLECSFRNIPEARDRPEQQRRELHDLPSWFPTRPLPIFDNPATFEKFDTDTLFFIFYLQQGTYQQYLAAEQLKKLEWHYHKKYLTWFQRHEAPKEITPEYEQGTYRYFDYESGWCQRKKTEFTFEYRYLED
ncbi:CCR4-NOT transcription complex subunit 3 [Pelomyxa schiedti]|nr:CCR4-NOT transcription complex subunit 3 [Pelomyxa schiedti]